jgi:MFS transporter, AAHS family, 3-hydroxyphenylpropionic acid transporter
MSSSTSRGSGVVTVGLCLAVALLEGLDLQSTGIAAPRMAHEFTLSAGQLGLAFGAGPFGLLPGAALGGRLADRFGRKRVLILSVVLFGVFSLATTQAWDFSSLLIVRALTGLGLGAAMPNLIALCSEAAGPERRSTAVGVMYCGMPFGAAIGALIGVLASAPAQWREVFYVGGVGPLLVAPLLAVCLPESKQFQAVQDHAGRPGVVEALLRNGRARTTVALWLSYLGTLIVLNFLMNWLPSMVIARGLSHEQGGLVLMAFNIGAGLGAIGIARLMDRIGCSRTVPLMYLGVVVALVVLARATGFESTALGGFLCGMFVVGGQSVLYALAGMIYPTEVRGTGVGAAVAVGRLGSMIGPMAAGLMFSLGSGPSMLVMSSIPLVIVAALSAMAVTNRFDDRELAAAART